MGQFEPDRMRSQQLERDPSASDESGGDQDDAGDTQYPLDHHHTFTR